MSASLAFNGGTTILEPGDTAILEESIVKCGLTLEAGTRVKVLEVSPVFEWGQAVTVEWVGFGRTTLFARQLSRGLEA